MYREYRAMVRVRVSVRVWAGVKANMLGVCGSTSYRINSLLLISINGIKGHIFCLVGHKIVGVT